MVDRYAPDRIAELERLVSELLARVAELELDRTRSVPVAELDVPTLPRPAQRAIYRAEHG